MRNVVRLTARWAGLAIGLFAFFSTARSCFTLRNQDLPEGKWAMLAPLVLLPLLALSVALPRTGAVLIVAAAIVSAVANAVWIARLGWLPGLGQLFLVSGSIAAVGVAIFFSRKINTDPS
jgi:hypothetical protein